MSTRKGNNKKGAPKHKNTFAFKHNPNSKKTKVILAINHAGLCHRCNEIIEWRKKYRKYKPLKHPRKCNNCSQKTVTLAYHTFCKNCAKEKGVCAKCNKEPSDPEAGGGGDDDDIDIDAMIEKLEDGVPGMRERDRRALLRQAMRGDFDSDEEEDGEAGAGKAGEVESEGSGADADGGGDDAEEGEGGAGAAGGADEAGAMAVAAPAPVASDVPADAVGAAAGSDRDIDAPALATATDATSGTAAGAE